MAERKRLGELLLEGGLIDEYQLKSALAHQKQWGGRLGSNMVKLGFITEDELVSFLSYTFRTPAVNLHAVRVPPAMVALIPKDVAKKYGVIPLLQSPDKKKLVIAMSDPTNLAAIDELNFLVGARVLPVIAADTSIEEAMAHYYDQAVQMKFLPNAKLSVEADILARPPAELPRRARKVENLATGKIDISGTEEEEDVVTGAPDEPDFSNMKLDDDDDDPTLNELVVFTGGRQKTIQLEEARAQAQPAPAAKPAADPYMTQTVLRAGLDGGKPTADQLVMALIRTLIDKGFVTKEEILAQLK